MGSRVQLDGHASVANAARANRRQAIHRNRAISPESMFVSPEPQQDTIEIWRQILADGRVARIERAEQLMMGQNDHRAWIGGVRENNGTKPLHDVFMQPDPGMPKLFDQRQYAGVVSAVQTQNPPVVILQAEIARLLIQRAQRRLEVALSS